MHAVNEEPTTPPCENMCPAPPPRPRPLGPGAVADLGTRHGRGPFPPGRPATRPPVVLILQATFRPVFPRPIHPQPKRFRRPGTHDPPGCSGRQVRWRLFWPDRPAKRGPPAPWPPPDLFKDRGARWSTGQDKKLADTARANIGGAACSVRIRLVVHNSKTSTTADSIWVWKRKHKRGETISMPPGLCHPEPPRACAMPVFAALPHNLVPAPAWAGSAGRPWKIQRSAGRPQYEPSVSTF